MAITDPGIQLALILRAKQFEKVHHVKCDLSLMMEVFNEILWENNRPNSLSKAINDIFATENKELLDAFLQLSDIPSLNLSYETN